MGAFNEISTVSTHNLKILFKAIKEELNKRKSFGAYGEIEDKELIPIGQRLRALPNRKKHYRERLKHFRSLLRQDWSFLFSNYNLDIERKFYVYAHVDPRLPVKKLVLNGINGIPFYIGKGSGDRAYSLKRNQGHGLKIKKLRKIGIADEDMVNIVSDGLTEAESLELEAKLVYFFGTKYENSKGLLYNLDKCKRPVFGVSKTRRTVTRKNKLSGAQHGKI